MASTLSFLMALQQSTREVLGEHTHTNHAWITIAAVSTHSASLGAQTIVVELEDLDGVEGRACQQGHDGFDTSGAKGIVAEVEFGQICLCCHDAFTKCYL